MVHEIKDMSDFEEQVKNARDKLVVIDFHAVWCGPCKMIAPVLQTLAEKYADKIVVVKVDVDENEELAMKFEVSSMPTFIFLKNGNKVDGFSGANADKLEKIILDRTN